MPSPHPKYVFRKALRSPHDRLLLALATLGLSPLIMGAAIPKRPNLIVILADDLGYGDLSGNNPDSKMPPHIWINCIGKGSASPMPIAFALCSPTRYR